MRKGISLQTKYEVVHFTVTEDWKDTPENRQELINEAERSTEEHRK